jgi:ferric-dicitrate binding protein FerR (iron transport regulator)
VGTEKRERQKANRALKHQQELQQASRRKRLRFIAIGVAAVAGVFLVAWIAGGFLADDEPATPVPVETIAPDTVPTVTSPATTPTTEG